MRNVYFKIAVNAISKKRIVYIPYIFSTAIMGMVLYILISLSLDQDTSAMFGGQALVILSKIGSIVFFLLSMIFNIYISFFVTRGRNKEYAVLNVLGMEKKHLLKIIFIENIILSIAGSVIGIVGGVVFYKLIQLSLIKYMGGEINYRLTFSFIAVLIVLASYAAVYAIISVIQIIMLYVLKPVEYMKSGSKGEKKGKLYLFFAILGVAILVVAYKLESSIPPDLRIRTFMGDTTKKFVFASILIVVATYLIFVFGSVAVLSSIKKFKWFFYRKLSFINLSTLAYRMRRSAIGLGTICILSTLAIILTAALLTFITSADDYLATIVPESFTLEVTDDEGAQTLMTYLDDYTNNSSRTQGVYDALPLLIRIQSGRIVENATVKNVDDLDMIYIIDEASYSALTDIDPDIDNSEFGLIAKDKVNSFHDMDGTEHKLVNLDSSAKLESVYGSGNLLIYPGDIDMLLDYYLSNDVRYVSVIKGGDVALWADKQRIEEEKESFEETFKRTTIYIVDVDGTYEAQYRAYIAVSGIAGISNTRSSTGEAMEFIGLYKGLTFLCTIILFLFIIMVSVTLYYKNLFEGIEDAPNYEVMRKLGMDDKLINRTVYIQMTFSLILPIALAAFHALFSERYVIGVIKTVNPYVQRSFQYLTVFSTIVAIVLYFFIGILASRNYIKIVKGQKKDD
ncbi:MAG: ABC transporter permease [Clostridia bacterium]|nr:ABC transporter permease [Clostridia bacterium]